MGLRAMMIEKQHMGGDCLVTGCVPSKAFLKSAQIAHDIKFGEEYGVTGDVKIDFGKVMERMRRIRAEISHHDSAEHFGKNYGIEVMKGNARFVDHHTLDVDGKIVRFKKACICTGGTPNVPDIPGIKESPFLTSENVFNLTEQPERIVVIGGGAIGCELGQGFQRLGTDVHIIVRG
jgi:pyruvate/2-oxoglutarate dehydrogenase complex dihydrolipoamide dehydrogenase (E3) component